MGRLGKFSFSETVGFAMISLNTNMNAIYAAQALAQSTRKIENLNKIINKTADAETAIAVTPTFLTSALRGTQFAIDNQVKNKLLVDEAGIAVEKIVNALTAMKALSPGDEGLQVKQAYISSEMAAATYNSMNLFNRDFKLQVGPNANDKFEFSAIELQDVLEQDPDDRDQVIASLATAKDVQNKIKAYQENLRYIDDGLSSSLEVLEETRNHIVDSMNSQARVELASQILAQQSAQLMLAQANVSAQSVIELIKSAAIPIS